MEGDSCLGVVPCTRASLTSIIVQVPLDKGGVVIITSLP
jgi:hypothetical protein